MRWDFLMGALEAKEEMKKKNHLLVLRAFTHMNHKEETPIANEFEPACV